MMSVSTVKNLSLESSEDGGLANDFQKKINPHLHHRLKEARYASLFIKRIPKGESVFSRKVDNRKNSKDAWYLNLEKNAHLTKLLETPTSFYPHLKENGIRKRKRVNVGKRICTSNDVVYANPQLQEVHKRRLAYMKRQRDRRFTRITEPGPLLKNLEDESLPDDDDDHDDDLTRDDCMNVEHLPSYLNHFQHDDGTGFFPIVKTTNYQKLTDDVESFFACSSFFENSEKKKKQHGEEEDRKQSEEKSSSVDRMGENEIKQREHGDSKGLIDVMVLKFIFGKLYRRDDHQNSICKVCGIKLVHYILYKDGISRKMSSKMSAIDIYFMEAGLSSRFLDDILLKSVSYTLEIQGLFFREDQNRFHLQPHNLDADFDVSDMVQHMINVLSFYLLSPMHILLDAGKVNMYDCFLVELRRRLTVGNSFENNGEPSIYGVCRKNFNKMQYLKSCRRSAESHPNPEISNQLFPLTEELKKLETKGLNLTRLIEKYCYSQNSTVTNVDDLFLPRAERNARNTSVLSSVTVSDPELVEIYRYLRLSFNIHDNVSFTLQNYLDKVSMNSEVKSQFESENCEHCKGKNTLLFQDSTHETKRIGKNKGDLFSKTLLRFAMGNPKLQQNISQRGMGESTKLLLRFRKESSVIIHPTYSDRILLMGKMMDLSLSYYFERIKKRSLDITGDENTRTLWILRMVERLELSLFLALFRLPMIFCDFITYSELNIMQTLIDVPLRPLNGREERGGSFRKRLFSTLNELHRCYENGSDEGECADGEERVTYPDNAGVGYCEKEYRTCTQFGLDPVYYVSKGDINSKIHSLFLI